MVMNSKKRILVCDDDEMLVDLLQYRLEARGFEVLVARDGGQALAMAQAELPDAIVLDAMMPVMNGEQVLRILRAGEAGQRIPVLMLTARRQERDIVGALELGANEYVVKPFIPEELVARLTRLVDTVR
jgi:DNA-binding response OmpR family regulator